MTPRAFEEARRRCDDALAAPELSAVANALERAGLGDGDGLAIVRQVSDAPESQARVLALKKTLAAAGVPASEALVERLLLLRAAQDALHQLPDLPVAAGVKLLFVEEVDALVAPDARSLPLLNAGQYSFATWCKLMTLRRLPAGQIHWEPSGVPRSWLLKVGVGAMPRVAAYVATRLRGLGPMFMAHMSWRRKNRFVLLESEQHRAYHRIARTLELQPEIRGFMAEAWFHSPDTHRVSPHLAWMNNAFLENGGLVAVIGPAHPESGVFVGGRERRRLYEAGEFKPTTAMALWARDAMIDWAKRHPEYADEATA